MVVLAPPAAGVARGGSRSRPSSPSGCSASYRYLDELLAVPRLRTAARPGLRARRTARARASTSRARRSAAAGSPSTSTCRRATRNIRAAATRCSTSCTAFPGRPRRSSRRCAWASSRTSSSRRTSAADDPRDAVRLDRDRSPTRSGRTASRRTRRWETFVARDVVRAIDARYRTIRSGAGARVAGLSEGGYGALNIGIHHPRRVPRRSRAGPATSTRTTSLGVRPRTRAAARGTARC